MRNLLFIIAFLFLSAISAFAQRSYFAGYYVQLRETIDDTDMHILISIDSVTEIRAMKINRGREMWMEVKSGTWVIKSADTLLYDYWLTLLFNDGTSQDLHFIPAYESFPPLKWMKPLYHEVNIGDAILHKERGENSFNDRIRNNINNQKM